MIRIPLFICLAFSIFQQAFSQGMQKTNYTYLALGDSYTIGHSLPIAENFPNQTVQLLSTAGYDIDSPTVVAKTGWTCEELQWGMKNRSLQNRYDIVSLLIGVNDQYRGGKIEDYGIQFEELVKQAVELANKNPAHVFVLSIPDWGATPFAEGQDCKLIAKELDSFNHINKALAKKMNVNYIDITPGSREVSQDHTLVAADGLHPSAKEYKRWAEKLAASIRQQFQ